MLKNTMLATLMLGLLLVGCGDDSGGDNNDAGTNGNAGTTAGTSSAGTGGTSAGGSGGSGGGGAGTGALTCIEGETKITSCDEGACPEVPAEQADLCLATCCTDDGKCGTRVASDQAGPLSSTCREPVVVEVDENCPTTTYMGQDVDGCCTTMSKCGYVSPFGCLPAGLLGGADVDCDGDADAGM